jgi:hypothetical protein
MSTSPCASSRSHRTKMRLGCASHPRPTSSRGSSCFSAESAQTMCYFGPRRLLARLRRTARRSGRMSSALIRCAHPIARCSECWSGAGWKSNDCTVSWVRKAAAWTFFFEGFFFLLFVGFTRWVVHLQTSGDRWIHSKNFANIFTTKSKSCPRCEITFEPLAQVRLCMYFTTEPKLSLSKTKIGPLGKAIKLSSYQAS